MIMLYRYHVFNLPPVKISFWQLLGAELRDLTMTQSW